MLLNDKIGIMMGVMGTSTGLIGSTFGYSPSSLALIVLSVVFATVGIVKIRENGPGASYLANIVWYAIAATPSLLVSVLYRPCSGVMLVGYVLLAHAYNTTHWHWSSNWTRLESAHAIYLFFAVVGSILVAVPKVDT
jgi:hypothetical protein